MIVFIVMDEDLENWHTPKSPEAKSLLSAHFASLSHSDIKIALFGTRYSTPDIYKTLQDKGKMIRARNTYLLAGIAALMGGVNTGKEIVYPAHPKAVDIETPRSYRSRVSGNNKPIKVNRAADKRRKRAKQHMRRLHRNRSFKG